MKQRITVISMGQTPRTGLVSSIMEYVDTPFELVEFGALDGLSGKDIRELEPDGDEVGISTLMSDGTSISISERWLRYRVHELCKGRGKTVSDLTVIASTGAFDLGNTNEFVIHSQNALDQIVESLILAGQIVGKIFPLPSHPYFFEKPAYDFHTHAYAASNDKDALERACNKLKNCDLIILNSMGYFDEDKTILRQYTEKPIISVCRIVGGIIAKTLKQNAHTPKGDKLLQGSVLSSRLVKLTKRERQVFEHVLDGLGNKEIGRVLEISYRTVEIHRARMLAKMGVSNSNELMRIILQNINKSSSNGIS